MPEFPNLIDLRSFIEDKFSPAGGVDGQLISAEEVRKTNASLQETLVARGVKVINDASGFASLSGQDCQLVFLKNSGLYQYATTGTNNPPLKYTASGGGVYERIFKSCQPDVVAYTANGTYAVPAHTCLLQILIIPEAPIDFKLGTSPGGHDLIPEVTIPAGGESKFVGFWPPQTTTLYLSGITSPTTIHFLIQ